MENFWLNIWLPSKHPYFSASLQRAEAMYVTQALPVGGGAEVIHATSRLCHEREGALSSSLSSLPSGQNAGKCWTQRWKPYVRKAGVMTEGTWVPNEHRAPASHPDFCLERNIHLSGLSSCHFMLRCHTGPPCGIPTHTAILDSPLCHPLIHPFIQSDWFYSQII